jgi:hypothetical protein
MVMAKKKKLGKPAFKDRGQVRRGFLLPLNDDEKASAKRQADAAGLPVAVWMRKKLGL